MSNLNPNVCMEQLAVAKQAIHNNRDIVAQMKTVTAEKLADYNVALADYNNKEALFKTALATFNNYKSAQDRGWEQEGSSGYGWSDGQCDSDCQSNQQFFPSFAGQAGGATITSSVSSSWGNKWWECINYC